MTDKLSEGRLHTSDFKKFSNYLDIAEKTGLIPDGYRIEGIQDEIKQNGEDVLRLRYTQNGRVSSFYTEHFSMVIRKADDLILGFVDLRKENAISYEEVENLPTEDEMPKLVKDFFKNWNSQSLDQLADYAYRSPYGENIMVNGIKRAIAGTEWKWFAPDTQDWGWVVFGKEKQPIIFERNIRWVNGRMTEKWLHDSYLETGNFDFKPVEVSE